MIIYPPVFYELYNAPCAETSIGVSAKWKQMGSKAGSAGKDLIPHIWWRGLRIGFWAYLASLTYDWNLPNSLEM
jgi:hypothetical protein